MDVPATHRRRKVKSKVRSCAGQAFLVTALAVSTLSMIVAAAGTQETNEVSYQSIKDAANVLEANPDQFHYEESDATDMMQRGAPGRNSLGRDTQNDSDEQARSWQVGRLVLGGTLLAALVGLATLAGQCLALPNAMSCAEGTEAAIARRSYLVEPLYSNVEPRSVDISPLLNLTVIDCQSPYDSMHREGEAKGPSEKRIRAGLDAMRQRHEHEVIDSSLFKVGTVCRPLPDCCGCGQDRPDLSRYSCCRCLHLTCSSCDSPIENFNEYDETVWYQHVCVHCRQDPEREAFDVAASSTPVRVTAACYAYRDKNSGLRTKQVDVPVKAKARLCCGGHLDPGIGSGKLRTDAPTVPKTGLMVFLMVPQLLGWDPETRDIECLRAGSSDFWSGSRATLRTPSGAHQ